jgi:hypothetical protein
MTVLKETSVPLVNDPEGNKHKFFTDDAVVFPGVVSVDEHGEVKIVHNNEDSIAELLSALLVQAKITNQYLLSIVGQDNEIKEEDLEG